MNDHNLHISHLARRMTNIRIGQRLVLGIMGIITAMGIPIILIITGTINFQARYNQTLDNLADISYIIQETETQGYRILDECTMGMRIENSEESRIIVTMLSKVQSIRANIGADSRYPENLQSLQIVDNLLQSYAKSYKQGAAKCGETFSLQGDMEFYAMVDTAEYIVRNCNKLLSLEMNRSEDLKDEISESIRQMLIITSIFVLVVIALMVGLAYVMTESITYPLGLLISHIDGIANSGLLGDESKETK